MRSKWWVLAAGTSVVQFTGCIETANETLVRIGFDLVFLPVNSALVSLFQLV